MVDGSLTNRFVSSAGTQVASMIQSMSHRAIAEPPSRRSARRCSLPRRRSPSHAQELDAAGEIEARQAEKQAELDNVSREITLSDSRVEALAGEIAGIKKDHASITAALIQAAKTERKLGEDIEEITGKLEDLKERQEEIRLSLVARRDVLAEVLGALQRMGLNPPPALAGQAGGRAVVGAQRHPARRRGAGTARSRPRCCLPTSRNCRGSPPRSRPSAPG